MASILERNKNSKIAQKKTMDEHAEDALYREVWEEVNAQKTYNFIKKNARIMIAAAIAVLIMVLGVQIYKNSRRNAIIKSAEMYEAAMSMTATEHPAIVSESLMRAAAKSKGGMADIALFQAARIDMLNNDRASATEKLTSLAKDGNTRDFKDAATINLVLMGGDSMTARDMERMMAPLMTKRSPFYYTGLLIMGQKYLADGDKANSTVWFDKIINDKNAPASISATAQSLR